VFDHDHRYIASLGDSGDNAAYGTGAVWIEVRRGLVEEEHARPQREDPGDGEPLFLSARERRGRAVVAVREADVRKRAMHPRPDLRRRDAVVLETESHVVSGSRHDQLGLWVLKYEARLPAYAELALLLAPAASVEKSAERLEERALPGAGRSY
jgi:hypothetical protein